MSEKVDSGNEIIKNSFRGGLALDYMDRPELAPPDSYIHALNAEKHSRDAREPGLTNKISYSACNVFGGDTIGFKLVGEKNWSIGMKQDGTILKHDHRSCESEEVMNPAEFGCDWGCTQCEWVGNSMEFYTSGNCSDVYMQWSCGCTYYIVNITEMLDPARKAGRKKALACESCDGSSGCEYFKVFKKSCHPKITTRTYESGGAGLLAGTYYFGWRYKYESGGTTNISDLSQPAYVGSEHNIGGEVTNGHIAVNLSCLECSQFGRGELVVVQVIGNQNPVAQVLDVGYDSLKYTYNYIGQPGTPIPLEEVLLPETSLHIEGRYQLQYKNTMLYFGQKAQRNLNYQGRALNISVGYKVAEMSFNYACKHNYSGLMRGEAYHFAIKWNYCDGTSSPAFPLSPFSGGCGAPDTGQTGEPDETFNPDATGGGSSGNSTGSGGSSASTGIEKVCEYVDTDPALDITYDVVINSGSPDRLSIDLTNNAAGTDLLSCIDDCVKKGNVLTKIYLTGHGGEEHTFDAYNVVSLTPNQIIVSGNSQGGATSAPVDAKHIYVLHVQPGSGSGPSNGGTGSSGTTGSGNTGISGTPTATIGTPQCVIRFRAHEPEDVSNPENDEWDDKLEEMLNKITSKAVDKCKELELIEAERRAEGCNCTEGSEGTILIPGSDCVVSLGGDDTGNTSDDGGYGFSDILAEGHPCADITGIAEVGKCCPSGSLLPPGEDLNRCNQDMADYEQGAVDYVSVLNDLGVDELDYTFPSGTFNDAAKALMSQAIQQRERIRRKSQTYTISKSVSYTTGGTDPTETSSIFGDNFTDCCGVKETETNIVIVSSGRPSPKLEQNIKYPCDVDCQGNFIYCGLADSRVASFQFPNACQEPFAVPKSVGVPHGTYWRDSNPYEDLYVRIMYPTFTGIEFPSAEETPKPLCPNNPYTILMAEVTDTNRHIVSKGIAFPTFVIDNNGEQIEHPAHGASSRMEVSAYHEGGGNYPRLANLGRGTSHNMFSPDLCIREPALRVQSVMEEGRWRGTGERFGVVAMGDVTDNDIHGERVDKLGARQAVNLSQWESGACSAIPLDFAIHVPAKGSNHRGKVAPPSGGNVPLMQAYQQKSTWIKSGLPQLSDDSLPGVMLEHNVPIPDAVGLYVSLRNDAPDQYGALETLTYIPILQAGKFNGGSIEGIVGDTFIGPYSFVKTSHVSDRYGYCDEARKFNIPNEVPIKKEKRCICDTPNDAIQGYVGDHVWTSLPESGDLADAKNWLGLRTHSFNTTDTYAEAGSGPAVSDFFYPRTATTEIIYPVESRINIWKREKSDLLHEQWMPELHRNFHYDPGVEVDGNAGKWEDSYLSQFGCELRQPSQWKKMMKIAIRSYIAIQQPMQGLAGGSNIPSTFSDTFAFASGGLLATAWHLMNQVLFTPERIDEILGIPVCKTDEVGHQGDGCIRGFFNNPCRYNWNYSLQNNIKKYYPASEEYNNSLCVCDQCEAGQTNNVISWSETRQPNGDQNAYRQIRPRNNVVIDPSEGKLTNLFISGDVLWYQTTDVTKPLRHGRAIIPSNIGEILLGTGDFLSHTTSGSGPAEGYAGLQHRNHFENTHAGPIWVDQEAAKIYWMKGNSIIPISDIDGRNWFKEHLPFCEETECKNEFKAGTSYYSLGMDPRNETFLITKSDGNPKGSWTLSFDFVGQKWISFHTEIPRKYNWDRYDSYQLQSSSYWKKHKDCEWGDYGEVQGEFEVSFSAVSPDLKEYTYHYSDVFLLVEECEGCTLKKDIDEFFTTIALYNSTQSTGIMNTVIRSDDASRPLDISDTIKIKESSKNINIYKNQREWEFNEIHDIVSNCDCVAMVTCDVCEPYHRINEAILNCAELTKQDYWNRIFKDRFIVYRYTYDNKSQKQFVLISNTTYIKRHLND